MDLIIIGNGFDKQCGLKSGFSDYYNHKLENDNFCKAIDEFHSNQNTDMFTKIITNHNFENISEHFSLWDILFLHEKNQGKENWADLEDAMYRSLIVSDDKFYWEKLMVYLDDKEFWQNSFGNLPKLLVERPIMSMTSRYIRRKYSSEYYKYGMTKEDLYYVLEEELKIFEDSFRCYMNELINDEYYKEHRALLSELSKRKRAILSFNYTGVDENYYPAENVHGTLFKEDIIIGIDAKELNFEEEIFRFTKTYRKMKSLNTKSTALILSKEITRLIFYGHSLNPQDYSYFQSIFDYLDLYSNDNIELIFYYSIYDKTREKQIEKEHYDSIVKLISIYGQTLDNKDKGMNLLHKLLLVGRIQIKEIKL